MQYRGLGETGLKVSPLCLGTMIFGSDANRATSERIIAAAADHGVNFIDTSNVYNKGRVTCRIHAVGVVVKPQAGKVPAATGGIERALKRKRTACFDLVDGFVDVPVYDRALLRPGDALEGPAIIEEPESTTICRAGWHAKVDDRLNIVITRYPHDGRSPEAAQEKAIARVA